MRIKKLKQFLGSFLIGSLAIVGAGIAGPAIASAAFTISQGGTNNTAYTANTVNYYDGTKISGATVGAGLNLSGGVLSSTGGTFAYPFKYFNNTGTTSPLLLMASTTVGDGSAAGGLTVSGNATTTGQAYFASSVGIGTSSPNSPLSIRGGNLASGTNRGVVQIGASVGTSNGGSEIGVAMVGSAGNLGYLQGFGFANGNAQAIAINPFGGDTLLNSSTGHVGIGTTSPFANLAISDNTVNPQVNAFVISSSTASATSTIFSVDNNGFATAQRLTSVGSVFATGGTSFLNGSQVGANSNTGTYQIGNFNASGSLGFFAGNAQGAVLTPTGNFGIGTTTPATLLDVGGSAQIEGTSLSINPYTGSASTVQVAGNRATFGYDGTNAYFAAGAGKAINFAPNAPTFSSANPAVVISTAGNLGIGTTSPGSALSVQGNIFLAGNLISTSTASSTFAWDINIPAGHCYQIAGVCPSSGGSGTVTSIIAGTGLSGGTITTSGTIAVNTTQNISTLSNLTVAGFVQTTSGGLLSSAALTSGQVTGALGFTPFGGTNPLPIANGGTALTSIGASSTVLVSNGTVASWQTPAGGANFFTNSGIFTYLSTGTNLGVGSSSPDSILTIQASATSTMPMDIWGIQSVVATVLQTGTTTITSSGSWPVPTGARNITVRSIGGGGGGAPGKDVSGVPGGGGGGGSTNFAAPTPCIATGGAGAGGGGLTQGTATGGTSSSGGTGGTLGTNNNGVGGAAAAMEVCTYSSLSGTITVTIGQPGTGGNQSNVPGTGGSGFQSGGSGSGSTGGGGAGATGSGGAPTAGTGGSSGGTTVAGASSGAPNGAASPYIGAGGLGGANGASPLAGVYGAGGGGATDTWPSGGTGSQGVVYITYSIYITNSTPLFSIYEAFDSTTGSYYSNVGIGTTTSTAQLAIQGNSGFGVQNLFDIWSSIGIATSGSLEFLAESIDKYGHLYTGGQTPTVGSCAGFAITGDDRTGRITFTSANSCSIVFANAWKTAPVCVASAGSSAAAFIGAVSTTGVTFQFSGNTTSLQYICQDHQ